jgi:hypothetical protein
VCMPNVCARRTLLRSHVARSHATAQMRQLTFCFDFVRVEEHPVK